MTARDVLVGYVAMLARRCELNLRCEQSALHDGDLLMAAQFADEAERWSLKAFAISLRWVR